MNTQIPVHTATSEREVIVARKPRTFGTIALVAASAIALAGCSQSPADDTEAPKNDSGSLVIDQAFTAQSIDPATIFQVTDSVVATGIYETLMGYEGADNEPKPKLARSYETNDTATEHRLELQEDATFANGDPVTAADVVFSFQRVKHLNSSPAYLMDGLTVEADGDHTVVIRSENPAPYLPHILTATAMSVVSAEGVRAAGGTDAADASETDTAGSLFTTADSGVGSGPYELESYDTNAQIVLTKNENYWGEPAAYDRIVIRNVSNAQQQKSNIEAGESHIALDIPGRIAETVNSPNLKVKSSPSPEVLYLGLSQADGAATADPDIVRAIQLGIDYAALRTLVGAGAAPATGIIPSRMIGALDEADAPQTDQDEARSILERAGKTGTTVTLDYANDYTRLAGIDYNVLAQGIQTQLGAIGLEVTLNPTPTSTSLQRYIDGETEMALWSWPPDYADPDNLLVFTPGGLIGERLHWSVDDAPEVAQLGETARSTLGEGRAAAYEAWNAAMVEQAPMAFLLEPSFFIVSSSSVSEVTHDPMAVVNLSQIR